MYVEMTESITKTELPDPNIVQLNDALTALLTSVTQPSPTSTTNPISNWTEVCFLENK